MDKTHFWGRLSMDKSQLEELQLLLTAASVLVKPPEKYYRDHYDALAALLDTSLKTIENVLTEDIHERGLTLAQAKLEEMQAPVVVLPAYEARLASILLTLAAQEFVNHGSNDFDLRKNFSPDERLAILKQYHGEDAEDEIALNDAYAQDSALMSMLAARLVPDGEESPEIPD